VFESASLRYAALGWLVVAALLSGEAEAVNLSTDGNKDFNLAGFPAMAILGGYIIVCSSLYVGASTNGLTAILSNKLQTSLLILNLFFATMLVFAPGATPGGGPAVNVIGLQLFGLVSVGFFAVLSGHSFSKVFYVFFAVFQVLATVGGMQFLGYTGAAWSVSSNECVQYFFNDQDMNLDRCDTKGFLQFVRMCSLFTVFIIFFSFSVMLSDITTSTYNGVNAAPESRDPFLGSGSSSYEKGATGRDGRDSRQPSSAPDSHDNVHD